MQPLRDLDQVRSFLAGGGPLGFFDLPWMPFYLAICFLFHPLIGIAALIGALILVSLTICAEAFTRKPSGRRLCMARRATASPRRPPQCRGHGRDGHGRALAQAGTNQPKHLDAHERRAMSRAGWEACPRRRAWRFSPGPGLGRVLVIQGEASAGIIIAGSILSARALRLSNRSIAHWKGFASARQSWTRLRELLAAVPEPLDALPLRKPSSTLSVEGVSLIPPGDQRLVVHGVSFALKSGSALGVIGPSASGKSSLARALVGVWRPARAACAWMERRSISGRPRRWAGTSATCRRTSSSSTGTIGQNIARFDSGADPEAIIVRPSRRECTS